MIDVPLYRHEVSLDFVRVELSLQYSFVEDWDVWLRLPYEVKSQRVRLERIQPVSLFQFDAQRRHTDAHHRSETYEGLSDMMVLVAPTWRGLLAEEDALTLAFGFTLPTGQTERDPFEAGALGQEHLHLQFGSGTVDPLLEVYYHLPLPVDLSLSGYATGRFPLYENPKSYQGPVEVTCGLGLGYALFERMDLSGEFTTYWQSFAHWSGHRDENSGLISYMAGLGLTVRPGAGFTIHLGARYPIYQRSLSDEGDTFEQGPSFLATAAWAY